MAEARRRAWTLAAAVALDAAAGEPASTWHPVAHAGRLLKMAHAPLRGRSPGLQLVGGAGIVAAVAALAALLGRGLEEGLGRSHPSLLALAVKPTFSVRQLIAEGQTIGAHLREGDLGAARSGLRALVSRPTEELTPSQAASAAIESMAENLADSIAAPWFYYALFGLAGAAAYRVINTADAMFGYRGEMEWLGKAVARADDALNWVPSRLAAGAIVIATALVLGSDAARQAIATWRADGPVTASPNAGRPMAAMAGSISRRLEKRGHYVLGQGSPPPGAEDVQAAAGVVFLATAILGLGAVALIRGRRR